MSETDLAIAVTRSVQALRRLRGRARDRHHRPPRRGVRAARARTAPARPRPSRSSRATARAAAARCQCSARTRRPARSSCGAGSGSCCSPGASTATSPRARRSRTGPASTRTRATSSEVLELVGLQEKADVRSRKLSGGQLRRLDFALALIGDPELIFLDEPTTGFDPEARRAAWETILLAARAGQDDPADHPLPRGGAGARRPRRDRQGRPRAGDRAAPGARGRGRAPTTSPTARSGGERVEIETDDPTTVLHEATGRALERGRAPDRDLRRPRPTLEDVYLELTSDA